jgi:hypothetical protein
LNVGPGVLGMVKLPSFPKCYYTKETFLTKRDTFRTKIEVFGEYLHIVGVLKIHLVL